MVYYQSMKQKLDVPYNVIFIEDSKDGNPLVEHDCGQQFVVVDNVEGCPHCGGDIIFPNADW